MKKFRIVAVIMALALVLAGCNKSENSDSPVVTVPQSGEKTELKQQKSPKL